MTQEELTKEIEALKKENQILRDRLELQVLLWAEIWKGLRMQEQAIARTMCLGEYRVKEEVRLNT